MDAALLSRLFALRTAPKAVMVAAGAGSMAAAMILGKAGASAHLLESYVPYSTEAMKDYLGHMPKKFVARDIALELAGKAYKRSCQLAAREGHAAETYMPLGVGCSAAVRSSRVRHNHHAYVAVVSEQESRVMYVRMRPGARERAEEETIVSRLQLLAMLKAAGGDMDLPDAEVLGLRSDDEEDSLTEEVQRRSSPIAALLAGEYTHLLWQPTGKGFSAVVPEAPLDALVYSGSFNPLHDGHLQLAAAAREASGSEHDVVFELAASNADKGDISEDVLLQRVQPFVDGGLPIVLSRVALFSDKALLWPKAQFVMGADTASRLLNAKYYGGSQELMLAELSRLALADGSGRARFIVGCRCMDDELLTGAEQLDSLPAHVAEQFLFIPPETFRVDLSSSALRALAAKSVEEGKEDDE